MEAELTITLWEAMFAACIFTLAGAGLMGISLAILVAARAHVCPVPEPEIVYVSAAIVDEPEAEYVPPQQWPTEVLTARTPAIDDDLADLHTRARKRDWYFPEPAQPDPLPPVPLLLYDASWNTVLGATGSFSVTDLEEFMASKEAEELARGFTTNGKRKRSKAGVR